MKNPINQRTGRKRKENNRLFKQQYSHKYAKRYFKKKAPKNLEAQVRKIIMRNEGLQYVGNIAMELRVMYKHVLHVIQKMVRNGELAWKRYQETNQPIAHYVATREHCYHDKMFIKNNHLTKF